MTPSTEDMKKVMQCKDFFAVLQLSRWGWFHTFFSKKAGPPIRYKVTARASKKEKRIGTNSWLAWGGRLLIGSLARRKEESRFYLHAKDVQMFP